MNYLYKKNKENPFTRYSVEKNFHEWKIVKHIDSHKNLIIWKKRNQVL